MKIIQLTPGTGNFYCGSCLRDNAMVKVMNARGHEAMMLPMYLPHMVDEEEAGEGQPLFFGGINVYLEQKFSLFRHTPKWVDRLFNSKWLLKWAAGKSDMTKAKDLGELAVSMVAGEEGKQLKEIEYLVKWLKAHEVPDVISLSNVMLIGLVRRLKEELGCKVVCTMQGEDTYLDSLVEPYRTECWKLLRERAVDVDRFIAVSDYHGDIMRERMGLSDEQVKRVWNGINLEGYEVGADKIDPPVIGYLARMCYPKRLHVLVDAYIRLKEMGAVPGVRLHVAGSMNDSDKAYVEEQRAKLEQAGVIGDVQFMPNLTHEEKLAFFRELSVFSVPATYGESFGLYVIEAWAAGVPVVQPRHGAFVELMERTGGGMLCEADDIEALAVCLGELLGDHERGRELGRQAREVVLQEFSVERMTEQVLEIMQEVVDGSAERREAMVSRS